MTKRQLVGVIVSLNRDSFLEALREPSVLREMCAPEDVTRVLRMSEIAGELLDTFDFSKSPEFLRSLEGKSDEFCSMKRRLITPVRRAETLNRLDVALANVLDSDDALDLVEETRHWRIMELRAVLLEVSNPDEPE